MAIRRRMSLGAAALPLLLAIAALLSPIALVQARRMVLETTTTNPDANKRWGAKPSCSPTVPNCATCDSNLKCTACCNTQLCGSSSYNYYLTSFGQCSLMMNFDNLPQPAPGYNTPIPQGLRGFNFVGDATNTALTPKISAINKASLAYVGRYNADKLIASQPNGLYTTLFAQNDADGTNVAPHLFALVPSLPGARFDLLSFRVTAVFFTSEMFEGSLYEYYVSGTLKVTVSTAAGQSTVVKTVKLSTAGPTNVQLGNAGKNLLWVDFDFIPDDFYAGGDPEMVFDDFAFVPRT